MNYGSIIKEIGRGAKGSRALEQPAAATLFGAMLDRSIPDLELGAILLGYRFKGETVDELLGFKQAMDERTAQLTLPPGPPCIVLPAFNGARRQSNLMPLLALRLAAAGVPVLIHGRHDFDQRTSPFDLLAELGIEAAATIAEAEEALATRRLACIDTGTLLPGLAALLALRTRMGVRTCAHTMAKLVDPCRGRSVRVVAVTHPEYLQRMDEFLRADSGQAMLLRGTEGEAYANPRRCPPMRLYDNGRSWLAVDGEDGGAPPLADLADLAEAAANAAQIRAMLAGELPTPAPIVAQAEALLSLATGVPVAA